MKTQTDIAKVISEYVQSALVLAKGIQENMGDGTLECIESWHPEELVNDLEQAKINIETLLSQLEKKSTP